MPGKSTSFQQVAPFHPKAGLLSSSYVAFPVDNNGNFIPPTLNIVQSCRSRSGTASLIGFSEVPGHESAPPKKYRSITGSGRIDRCVFAAPGCASLIGSDSNEFSGTRTYNILTGVISGAGEINVGQDSGICPSVTHTSTSNLELAWPLSVSGGNLNGFSLNSTATAQTITGLGVCFISSEGVAANATGSLSLTISAEDTEDDAIARFEANNDWSEWAHGDRCIASRQNRTSGFTFAITEGQFKLEIGGLPVNREFAASLDVYRSIRGDDNFVFFTKIFFSATSSLSGTAEITGNVPIYVGYDSFVTAPAVL